MAAEFRSTSVPQLLHGVSGGRSNAGPSHKKGPEGSPQNGRQLSQVLRLIFVLVVLAFLLQR